MKSEKDMSSEFHSVVLNQLDTGVFITEADTDRIVYMNETMKQRFQLVDPEGKPCYKVLQK
ncbi:PAS domain-containing protein, partial [Dielma fastidiosa]